MANESEQEQHERDEQILGALRSGRLRNGSGPAQPIEPEPDYPPNWLPGRKNR